MNSTSRFSLTCDELARAIEQGDRSRALELVERLRAIFSAAFRPREEENEGAR